MSDGPLSAYLVIGKKRGDTAGEWDINLIVMARSRTSAMSQAERYVNENFRFDDEQKREYHEWRVVEFCYSSGVIIDEESMASLNREAEQRWERSKAVAEYTKKGR